MSAEGSSPVMQKSVGEMIDFCKAWPAKFPFVFIEGPFDQDDRVAYSQYLAVGIGMLIVGDDLLVTNPTRARKVLDRKACNARLLNVILIGSLTEAIQAANMAMSAGWGGMVSHRLGEAEDSFIADLVAGLHAPARRPDQDGRALSLRVP